MPSYDRRVRPRQVFHQEQAPPAGSPLRMFARHDGAGSGEAGTTS